MTFRTMISSPLRLAWAGVVAGGCAVAMAVAPAQADSLRAALGDAYANSQVLEQNRQLLRLQDERAAQRIANLRPVVNFVAESRWLSSDIGPPRRLPDGTTHTLSLVADLLVFDNGGSRDLLESAREIVLAARYDLVSLEQQVLLDAAVAYTNVWRDIQEVEVRESNVRVVSEQLRAARNRFAVGEDTRTDVAQAEAQLAAAQSSLAAARGQLEISRERFLLAVGRPVQGAIAPETLPDVPDTEDAADQLARQQHPAIRSLQHQVRANEWALAAARSDYGPELTLRAQADAYKNRVIQGTPFDGTDTSLSLRLTQPLYRGGQLFALERSAIATLAASEFELQQQARAVVQTVGNAYAQLRIANAQIQAADQQIRAAQLALEGIQEGAALGARTTLDVLDAEQDLLEARIGRIRAQANLHIQTYVALESVGLLTVEHLGLDVPQYDPGAYTNAFINAPQRVPSLQGARLDAVLERLGRN
ncbi:MAG: TolC family outer membrane protein [Rhodobacteraceae bacterium]|nr:TolC family outer membrane protein [Paracoccaceae bacterium]